MYRRCGPTGVCAQQFSVDFLQLIYCTNTKKKRHSTYAHNQYVPGVYLYIRKARYNPCTIHKHERALATPVKTGDNPLACPLG